MQTNSPMLIPIFRKILSALFIDGSLRSTEILEKMPEEAKSSFYNAMKKLEDEGLIIANVRLRKLVVYSLTENGKIAVNESIEKNPSAIIGVISKSVNYDDLFCKIIILDIKKRIGIEEDVIGDGVLKELVKKNYGQFLKTMHRDLNFLMRS